MGACARDGPQFEPHPPDHFPAPPHEPAPPWIEGSEVGTGHGPIFERALKQTANHLTRRARTPDEKARAGSPPGERLCRNPRATQCAQERSLARETPRPRFVRARTNTHREAGRDPSAGTCTPQPPEEKPPTAQNWTQAAATPHTVGRSLRGHLRLSNHGRTDIPSTDWHKRQEPEGPVEARCGPLHPLSALYGLANLTGVAS